MSFDTLGLPESLARAVADAGYTTPTEVQSRAIPPALAGADLMVSSSTGSGKTASFVLPALTRILAARGDDSKRREKGIVHGPRILVLAPTRELAMQVAKATNDYGRHIQGLRVATIVGGVPYGAQLKALRGPLDVLIATPGRLMDHMASGKAVLENIEMLVLDEADRMLDMGFIDDIHHIAQATPAARQTVMYSATFAGHVGRLAEDLLREPQRIEVASHTDAHADIEQRLHWADDFTHKNALLDSILTERSVEQAVVFTSTQRDADWLADRLAEMGHHVASLHGGHPQGRRTRVLHGLRSKALKILVATDVAARGIDVPTISHVINYGLPMKAEDYVHRIGRTGRAGRAGLAVTIAERRDAGMIHRIQRFTTQRIPSATIAGLEPKLPEPSRENRPAPGGKRFGGKPFGGGKPFAGKSFGHGGGKPFGHGPRPQGEGRGFGGEGHEGRGFGGEAPRGRGFDPRFGGDAQGPRGFGEGRGPAHAHADRPAFGGDAPRKPFGPGAKPFGPGPKRFGGKPADGGFGPKGPRRPREA